MYGIPGERRRRRRQEEIFDYLTGGPAGPRRVHQLTSSSHDADDARRPRPSFLMSFHVTERNAERDVSEEDRVVPQAAASHPQTVEHAVLYKMTAT